MLSRTANGLFWMSRYVERASNIARLLDAGRRMDNIPNSDEGRASEWESILIASGSHEIYDGDIKNADMESVARHLIFNEDNPSSILCCMKSARENARAMRIAVTREVWDVLNSNWAEMRGKSGRDITGGRLAEFLDWVKNCGFLFQGAVEASMLRDEGRDFITLGMAVERSDATARLIDVKYHVLLPDAQDVGGGLDHMQWVQLLRATNSLRAFRWIYRETVTPQSVVHFLILNKKSPRSIIAAMCDIVEHLESIGGGTPDQRAVCAQAREMLTTLDALSVEQIIGNGLHEWLTRQIADTNVLAGAIAHAYGFNGPELIETQSQSQ
ncbi:alpha-E domain-containing protein [Pontivivens nitratireducens]|uniref:Alpha-E domain-containing protein n=1 Tax=Pontivivens nitratireducens TaxID=2758038 RepID=A0A6G7VLX6_9RHOB|nr:alpha-E domain-containing protein [Pontibrevibacter nitratireducens]QIK41021.1 alpha-E domain-containing protein [Pontibrevibacter nitratireducens]